MKTVYWLLKTAGYGLAILVIAVSNTSCGSDSEVIPQNDISVKSITPESPADLVFYETGPNDRVTIEYDYNISHAEGARIWIQPYSSGQLVTDYIYSSSSIFKGTGSRTVVVSVGPDGGEAQVDQLKVNIKNPDQSIQLTERFIDVDYNFK